jgi:hypothetical protein
VDDLGRALAGRGAGKTRTGVLASPPRESWRRLREVVAVRRADRIRHEPGSKATPSARDHPALFDGEDLDPVVAKEDVIADRLADQSARDGRDIGDRSRSGIGFVLPNDPERLPSAVVAGEHHP